MPIEEKQSDSSQVEKQKSSSTTKELQFSKISRSQKLREILELLNQTANHPVVRTQKHLIGNLSEAGVKIASICIEYEKLLKANAISISCPICLAGAGAKCLKQKKDGWEFTDELHQERIDTYFRISTK